jgi:hypothetical protein
MNNQSYALVVLSLILGFVSVTKLSTPTRVKVLIWTLPSSKGCMYPTKSVSFTRTEIKHIVPIAKVHKCTYDKRKRLVRVSTYNFERGFQMKKPTEEVLYEWLNYRLVRYSIRRATHGNGELDMEVYRLN